MYKMSILQTQFALAESYQQFFSVSGFVNGFQFQVRMQIKLDNSYVSI